VTGELQLPSCEECVHGAVWRLADSCRLHTAASPNTAGMHPWNLLPARAALALFTIQGVIGSPARQEPAIPLPQTCPVTAGHGEMILVWLV
jgi:hypothetical protein